MVSVKLSPFEVPTIFAPDLLLLVCLKILTVYVAGLKVLVFVQASTIPPLSF